MPYYVPRIKPEKIAYGIILFCVALFIFVWISGLIGQRARMDQLKKTYKLAPDFKKMDIELVIGNLLSDPEFQVYSRQLSEDDITQAANDVYNDIKNNPGEDSLFKKIEERVKLVQSLAERFRALQIPKDFSQFPENYPAITDMMQEFLLEEFKLTVLGVLFRFNYEFGFEFHWDEASIQSAAKVRKALREIDPKKRALH